MGSYIKKHWRGELSLPVSYWLNSFLANIFAITLVTMIGASIERSINPFLILLAFVAIYSLLLAITVWQITGTWRSADNHKEKTGRKGWAIAAQVMIILGIIQSVKVFTDGTKQIIEVAKVATGTDKFVCGGDKLDHGSGGFSCRGRIKTLPPVAFDLFGDGRWEDVHRGSLFTSSACLSC